MIDNDMKVHVLEVNGRPQLQNHCLDKAVNRPMLNEILRIVGYHIPKSSISQRSYIADKFELGKDFSDTGDAVRHPTHYQYMVYTRVKIDQDIKKQSEDRFKTTNCDRESYTVSNKKTHLAFFLNLCFLRTKKLFTFIHILVSRAFR